MKKIYISGQITGLSINTFSINFENAENYINKNIYLGFSGFEIINPLNIVPFLGIRSWLTYMITDIYHLRRCTHICMQKNWIHSKGACIEHLLAKFVFKLEVIYL